MPDQESIIIQIDERPATAAVGRANAALDGYEKRATAAGGSVGNSFQKQGEIIIRTSDRSRSSMERLVSSAEKLSQTYGKTGIEKLVIQRDLLIKRLGGEEQAVDRVRLAYDRMIKAEQGHEGHGAAEKGFLAAKDLFEGRNAYAAVEAGKTLTALQGFPAVLGATAAAFSVAAIGGYEAAKSLAEYGVQIRDVELRTGLTAKEVGQFGFAAKAVGQDVSIFERLMRGLTQALDGTSTKGEAARVALKGLDLRDIEGNIRPTSDVLLEISTRLNALPNVFERNKAGMDIFKKGWIEAAPVVLELSENVERAKQLGLGPNESDVQRWIKYQKQLTEVDFKWEQLKRAVKEPLAATIIFTVKAVGKLAETFLGIGPEHKSMGEQTAADIKIEREQEKIYSEGGPQALTGAAKSLGAYLRNNYSLESAQAELSKLKKTYDESRVSAEQLVDSGKILPSIAMQHRKEVEAASTAYERQKGIVESISKAENDRKSNLEAIRKATEEQSIKKQYPYGLQPSEQKVLEFASKPGVSAPLVKQYSDIYLDQRTKESQDLITRARAEQQKAAEKSVAAAGLYQPGIQTAEDLSSHLRAQSAAADRDFLAGLARENKQLESEIRASAALIVTDRESQLKQAEAGIRIGGILNDRKPEDALRTESRLLAARKGYLDDQYRHERDLVEEQFKYDESLDDRKLELRLKHASDVADLEMQLGERVAEEQRRQFDTIQHEAEGLVQTLFNRPSDFGKQFGATIKAAVLKPITEGLSNTVAGALQPLIYGRNGNGGIAGSMKDLFGAKPADQIKLSTDMLKGSTDLNSNATDRNTDALRSLTQTWGRRESSTAAPAATAFGLPSVGSWVRNAALGAGIAAPAFAGVPKPALPAPTAQVASALGIQRPPIEQVESAVRFPENERATERIVANASPGFSAAIPIRRETVSENETGGIPDELRRLTRALERKDEAEAPTASARENGPEATQSGANQDLARHLREQTAAADRDFLAGVERENKQLDLGTKATRALIDIDESLNKPDFVRSESRPLERSAIAPIKAIESRNEQAIGAKPQDIVKVADDLLRGSTDVNNQETSRNSEELRRLTQVLERKDLSGQGGSTEVRRLTETIHRTETTTAPRGGILGALGSFARKAGGIFGLGAAASSVSGVPALTPQVTSTLGGSDMEGLSGRGGFEGIAGGVPYQPSPIASSLFGDNPAFQLGPGGTAGLAPGEIGGGGYSGAPSPTPSGGILGSLRGIFGGGQSQSGQQSGGILGSLRGIFGGGQSESGSGGFGGILGGLKGMDWGGITRAPNVMSNAGQTVGSAGSHITGVGGLAGAGLMMGGSMLAQQGLLGSSRGTWGGIAMGTAGGAAIGFQMGGPIGAAIGAAAGFGIGLGEKLAGVEPPESHAKKLIKELYSVNIDTNMARSIVQIANQKYGKAISVAVRSPEVRQMMELYAAGTGQKMPMSAATPHGAILSEQRGQLFQEQTYKFGQGFTHQSSLPVAGGGNPGTYPTAQHVTLNINGQSAADLLEGRIATTVNPSFVQDRFAQAQQSSNGRLQNSALLQVPGLVFG